MVRRGSGWERSADLHRCAHSEAASAVSVLDGRRLWPAECHVHFALWRRGPHNAPHRHPDGHRLDPGTRRDDLPPARMQAIAHERPGEGGDRRGRTEALGAPPDVAELRAGQHHGGLR